MPRPRPLEPRLIHGACERGLEKRPAFVTLSRAPTPRLYRIAHSCLRGGRNVLVGAAFYIASVILSAPISARAGFLTPSCETPARQELITFARTAAGKGSTTIKTAGSSVE